ncbi:lytic polysaccharide monooxygenase [Cucurbitaria berberidis CBS 394.84]|uniref:AA9 family lytic polysaccharide monooxygenase n=1 Tax=Cucurbitaria berberidis CBS 394.84 TaxID=1168544 RepID=A0A9P4GJF0_9PLEO|nr:lytic polysaccharide monooxygenase [Cucurbitaria berberidis CBS 394.84]KAF1846690.1 lytic polysaccharide monooxygenase [Cucurbitaria berberidis CBS 394.84]
MLLAALASAPAALAHTVFTDFFVNGQPQGDGVAMRMSPNSDTAGSPINGLGSEDMACNVGGTKGVSRVQSVPDGALLSFEIRSWADDPSKPPLDRGHKGPCAVYLKKVSSAINDKAAGDGWFKLFDHGYDSSTQRWCTDEIIDNKGLLSINLPKGLEGGYYLARPEILALHAANNGDPQFYTGCAQIFLESTGNLVPESTVSIPGHVQNNQPSTNFDIYNTDNAKYTVPGPAVAKLTAKGTQSGSDALTSQTEGQKPDGCLVENANWCGHEVPSYTDETGCWAASKDCYAQGEVCWNTSPPTGNAGCKIWQTKCQGIQAECTAKNFNGPPNKGKVLTPEKSVRDVGKVMATVGGGIADAPAPKTSATNKEASKTETPAKATDAPTTKEADKEESKPQTSAKPRPAKTTPVEAAAPKPTPVDSDDSESDSDDEPATPAPASPAASSIVASDAPLYTITVAPSSAGAPAPTEAPQVCPKGFKCITETVVVTQTVYVTAAYDSYKKRSGSFRQRRHPHRH